MGSCFGSKVLVGESLVGESLQSLCLVRSTGVADFPAEQDQSLCSLEGCTLSSLISSSPKLRVKPRKLEHNGWRRGILGA